MTSSRAAGRAMQATRLLVPALAAVLAGHLPRAARAATTQNWCIRWGTSYYDSGVGEDYGTASSWYGRGVKVRVTPPGGTTQTYYASPDTGCFSFTNAATSGYLVRVFAETRIGGSNNIKVRAFSSQTAYSAWLADPIDDNLESWLFFYMAPTCSGNVCSLTVTTSPTTDAVAMLMAASTWSIHQIDVNTTPRLSGSHQLFAVNHDCISNGTTLFNTSCQAGDAVYISPGDPSTLQDEGQRRKFLIGHEVGHWLQSKWIGGSVIEPMGTGSLPHPYNLVQYDFGTLPLTHSNSCNSGGVPGDHALRSEEYQGAAFVEGSAHFLSTLAFNSSTQTDAWFKYYKRVESTPYDYNLVDVEAVTSWSGGGPDWLHNGCTCGPTECNTTNPGYPNYEYPRGVELDWLRFYWDFRTDAPPNQPTNWDILNHWAVAWNVVPHGFQYAAHARLESTLPVAFASRWDQLADASGADASPD